MWRDICPTCNCDRAVTLHDPPFGVRAVIFDREHVGVVGKNATTHPFGEAFDDAWGSAASLEPLDSHPSSPAS